MRPLPGGHQADAGNSEKIVAGQGELEDLDKLEELAGIDMPTLCYHSDLSTFGACRPYAPWKTTGGSALPPAPRSQGTAWLSTPTPSGCAATAS